jgi:hypothetical protein
LGAVADTKECQYVCPWTDTNYQSQDTKTHP